MEKYFIIILLFTFLSLSNSATRVKVDDLFNGLYSGDVYSGYLQTTISGDELFYIYMPAQNKDANAPVMLWLNGGPGCSSLFGLLAEVGPVTSDNFAGEFKLNEYSWNKEVNLLAIEQPAGVGFSRASNPEYKPLNKSSTFTRVAELDKDKKVNNKMIIKDFSIKLNLIYYTFIYYT